MADGCAGRGARRQVGRVSLREVAGGGRAVRPVRRMVLLATLVTALLCCAQASASVGGLPQAASATGTRAAGVRSAANTPQAQITASRAHELGYSLTPSDTEPYAVCPQPTKSKAECMAIIAPTPKAKAGAEAKALFGLGPEPEALHCEACEGTGEEGGYSPSEIRKAYDIPETGGSEQTVAIVDAYDDPHAEADLEVYRKEYGLPKCTAEKECFRKVNQSGEKGNYPEARVTWGEEISLDLDMVSAVCPECKILLVEAKNEGENTEKIRNLYLAEDEAVTLKATVISNSWGYDESSEDTTSDKYFDHPDVPIAAASGDEGYGRGLIYPAASQDVISVGGTTLHKAEKTSRGWEEKAWEGTGSGCSAYEPKPAWQADLGCAKRTDNDVAAVADPYTPVSVYDSYGTTAEEGFYAGWGLLGGTSAATPIIAAVEAHASKAAQDEGAEVFYRHALFDVIGGSNDFSECRSYLCLAWEGYDGPTGSGSPDGPLESPAGFHAVTASTTGISSSGAKLNGYVNPEGAETTYQFEYGKTTSYGTLAPSQEASVGSGVTWKAVSQAITGLELEVTYHYRLVAHNSSGTVYGKDHTFTTSPWAVQANPSAEEPEGLLRSVSCSSSTACTAVGAYERGTVTPLAERWNGTTWQIQTTQAPVGAKYSEFSGVSCSTSSSCTAVGSYENSSEVWVPLAEYWNGTEWQTQTVPSPTGNIRSGLSSVSCSSAEACVAVGRYENSSETILTLAEIWTGSKWRVVSPINPEGALTSELSSISCSSSTSCIAVGNYLNSPEVGLGLQAITLAEAWNGTEWQIKSTPSFALKYESALDGVSCSASTACTAVGWKLNSDTGDGSAVTLAERWNGTEWQTQETPIPSEASNYGLDGISCSSSVVCTAVGFSNSEGLFAERWSGGKWALQTMAVANETYGSSHGVACVSQRVCVVVGRNGGESGNRALLGRESLPQGITEAPSGVSGSEATLNGVVNPEESDTHYHFEYGPTTSYGTKVPVSEADVGSGTSNVKVSQIATELKYGTVYHFRIVASNSSGTTYGADQTIRPFPELAYTASFGSFGSGLGQMEEPTDLAVDGSGNVWVADWQNSRLDEFNSKGEFVRTAGSYGSGPGQFEGVEGVALDLYHPHVWASDYGTDRIDEFSSTGTFEHAYGSRGSGNAQFDYPDGLALNIYGTDVYVADRGNHRVEELLTENEGAKKAGEFVRSFSKPEEKEGPSDVAFDYYTGDVWVTYGAEAKVAEFTAEGKLLVVWGTKGTAPGDMEDAYRLKIGPEGDIWLAEWGNNRVQVFTPAGEYVYGFGSKGSGEGQFLHARGIDFNGSKVYVLDSGEGWQGTGGHVEEWLLG